MHEKQWAAVMALAAWLPLATGQLTMMEAATQTANEEEHLSHRERRLRQPVCTSDKARSRIFRQQCKHGA